MAEDYSCQHAPCARHLPRRTAYCPYCGTRQSAATPSLHKPVVAPAATAGAAPAAAPTPATASTSAAASAPASAPTPGPAPAPATARPAPTKMPPFVAPVPKRKPWWRWPLVWLAFVGIGALIGKSQRPFDASQSKVEAIETLIQDCKLDRARQDLPALRKLDADQAKGWQVKIDQAKSACDDKRTRERDWNATLGLLNKAIDEPGFDKAAYDKALGRLNWFNKRWIEDPSSRSQKHRLDARYARYLLDVAERCQAQGNWPCVKQRLVQWEHLDQDEGRARARQLRDQVPALISKP